MNRTCRMLAVLACAASACPGAWAQRPGPRAVLLGHKWAVQSLAFSPDGETLATLGLENDVRLWDARTGAAKATHFPRGSGLPSSLIFSHDGKVLVVSVEKSLNCDTFGGDDIGEGLSTDHVGRITDLALTRDGTIAVTSGDDGRVGLTLLTSFKVRTTFYAGRSRLLCVALSPDGKTIAAGGEDMVVHLWDANIPEVIADSQKPVDIERLRERIAVFEAVGQDPDPDPGPHHEERVVLKGAIGDISRVAFTPDGKTLVAGTRGARPGHPGRFGGFARAWEVATGRERAILKGGNDDMSIIALSPDGKMLATAGKGTSVRLWDLKRREVLATLDGHKATNPEGVPLPEGASVNALAFSPDGKTMASGGEDGLVLLWDVPEALAPEVGHGR